MKNIHTHSHHNEHTSLSYGVLCLAIAFVFIFALIELIAGTWSGSLALMSDSGHMASDGVSLIIAGFAAWLSKRPPSMTHSYGLGRAEVVAAWISSMVMIFISVVVIVHAIERIKHPVIVQGQVVIVIAFLGIVINSIVAWLLAKGERTLNIRAALLHVMADMLGSVAALVAGAIIYFSGWLLADPIFSILIGILILFSSLQLLRESLLVLMEGVPGHLDLQTVSDEMEEVEGVQAIHDLHIWTLSSGTVSLSAHVDIADFAGWQDVHEDLILMLKLRHQIAHVTLQPEVDATDCHSCQ